MVKVLKKYRKKFLVKQHIMGELLKEADKPELRKCLENAIKVVKKNVETIELQIKHLSKNVKFKDLNLDTVSTRKSLKKWMMLKNLTYQKLKVLTVDELNECAGNINELLAYHQTLDEFDSLFIISNDVMESLKHLRNGYNVIIDDIIGITEE